jgi:hypothetical protein
MDCTRQKADSPAKYKLYLDLLHSKIEDYGALPANMYNPNEKDFMRSHWLFETSVLATSMGEKESVESFQDGLNE